MTFHIVRDMMTTHLVTVEPDNTVGHAANLFRQHQFHHLPVVRKAPHHIRTQQTGSRSQQSALIFQGLLTTEDIEMAMTLASPETVSASLAHPWQDRHVAEIMHSAEVWVTPTTSVAAAAQLLVERGINCLAVIESREIGSELQDILVGLLTRSDILLALARSLGAFEPGTQISIQLPHGRMVPLARALLAADELHIGIGNILAVPHEQHSPRSASLRLRTINPGPLLTRLKQEGIVYHLGDSLMEGEKHA
jgi:acetoin utilization protein AcuB